MEDENKKVKRKLSKPAAAATVIVAVLVVAFSVALPLFLKANQSNRDLYGEQQIELSDGADLSVKVKFDDVLKKVSAEDFRANYKPNGKVPITRTYTGVELKNVLAAYNISTDGKTAVRFTASDGVEKLYPIADVMKDKNVFIAFKVGGKAFNKGVKANAYDLPEEDGGPFVVVRASDQFSQDRVKMLTKISLS